MQQYKNLSGESNIASYQIGEDYIIVGFEASKYSVAMFYKYTYAASGQNVIDHMKQLALHGAGLNSFINTHPVKKQYIAKGPSPEGL
ncbi:MAG: hypothetical protein WBO49_00625 [Candidatus Saccharimonas sp.]